MNEIRIDLKNDNIEVNIDNKHDNIEVTIENNEKINTGGTTNYNDLYNKPQINTVSLEGNKTSLQLKLQDQMDAISNFQIEEILKK